MNGTIVNYRLSKHVQTPNQMVVKIEGVATRDKAEKYVGKTVVYNTGKKDMKGKISSAHGNSGAVRVLFETGMPGQAVGKQVQIN